MPYVREYTEDREITAWFLLDLSPGVDFGTVEAERQKRSVLIDFVSALARLLTRHGNRVGAMLYASSVGATIPARGGRDQVLRLIRDLLEQPQLTRAPATDLRELLDRARRQIKRRSLVYRVRLRERARLGTLAGAAGPPPRGARRSGSSIRGSSSCRTWDR